jgi:ribokinase
LRRQGVDIALVRATEQAPTGVALITVDAEGQNTIVVAPGSNAWLTASDVAGLPLQVGDIALAQLEAPLETVACFLAAARAQGAKTLLNASPAIALPSSLLETVDVLIVNELELASYLGLPEIANEPARVLDAAERLRTSARQSVIVTLGREGAVAVSNDQRIYSPSHAVDVVDTTGAGDAFVGALAATLIEGASLESALENANAAGAYAVGLAGAAESSPSAAQLSEWRRDR